LKNEQRIENQCTLVEGVRFLWHQVFESTARIANSLNRDKNNEDQGGSGAILAHCMGLGKTFTTISLIHTLFRYAHLTHIHRILILCPLNTANKYSTRIIYRLFEQTPVDI
jgi:transcriptional regulator ATRX